MTVHKYAMACILAVTPVSQALCQSATEPAPEAVPASDTTSDTGAPDMAGDNVLAQYRFGIDDKIALSVFGEPDLSREWQIGPDGTVDVPLIGTVQASGRTADDIRNEITMRLADGYIRNPSVTISTISLRPFFILGEVNKPGQYPYRKGMTVLGAIATAEGFTYRAQKKWVVIKHENDGTETRTEVTPTLLVRPGDIIRIAERYF